MSGTFDKAGSIQSIVGAVHARSDSIGPLLLIGGEEDRLGARVILRTFVNFSGGRAARIAIIPGVSLRAGPIGRHYAKLFQALGASAEVVDLTASPDPNKPTPVQRLEQATGIFITSGSQNRLLRLIAGTPVHAALLKARRRGCVIAGTGSGAAILGSRLIVASRRHSRQGRVVSIGEGLGLLEGVLVDRHFAGQRRAGRLLKAVDAARGCIGLGIDEETAMLLTGDGRGMVVGSGTVTVMLPSSPTATSERTGERSIARCMLFPGQTLNILMLPTDSAASQ